MQSFIGYASIANASATKAVMQRCIHSKFQMKLAERANKQTINDDGAVSVALLLLLLQFIADAD